MYGLINLGKTEQVNFLLKIKNSNTDKNKIPNETKIFFKKSNIYTPPKQTASDALLMNPFDLSRTK